jgi:flagellar biosynthesis protein FlhF
MARAIAQVRAELGEDAIIVSNHAATDGRGVEVIAAIEPGTNATVETLTSAETWSGDELDILQEVLDYHRVPPRLIEKLYSAARVLESDSPLMALAGALDAGFQFSALPTTQAQRPFMLVGPPGAGKTATLAKLAARAIMVGQPAGLITTDTVHTGATEQFASYAKLLRMKFWTAGDAPSLQSALAATQGMPLTLVDTTGANPFEASDLTRLTDLIGAAGAEPILVLPAGMDPAEAAETAEAFQPLGIKRMVTTRLDTARRLGGLLAASDAAQMQLSEAGCGPQIAGGLHPLDAAALARALTAAPAERVSTLSASR